MRTPPADLVHDLSALAERVLTDPALRLEDVAALVGTSRARLYYYFAGLDDLRAFLVRRHLDEGAAVLADADDEGRSPVERLRVVVEAAAAYLAERPGVCAGLLSGTAGSVQEVLRETDAAIAAPLRRLVAAGVRSGDLAAPDIATAADGVLGAVLLAVLGRWSRGGATSTAAFSEAVARQVVEGLRSR